MPGARQRVRDQMASCCGFGVDPPSAVWLLESADSASIKWSGSTRPRFSARRRMPWAARADSEYVAGTVCGGSRISVSEGSDDEHPSASLRHSEETAVENPPAQAVPDVGQRSKDCSEVPTAL
jgi:hypothetical protein